MAKKIQTDYTKAGNDISQTSVPYYKNALTNMNDYLADPTQYMDKYLKYYDNTASQSDFMRNYQRSMANATSNNYAATHGGYSSAGQRAYNDNQRYMNDLAARQQEANTSAAAQLAQNYFNNNLSATSAYGNAYGLGKEYSDIEQYNNLAKQNNSFGNQLMSVGGSLASSAGKVLSTIPTPITQGIGAGLQGVGGIMSSQSIDPTSVGMSGTSNNSGLFDTKGISQGLGATAKLGGNNWATALYGLGTKKNNKKGTDNEE